MRGLARKFNNRYPVSAQRALMEQHGLTVIYAEEKQFKDHDLREAWGRSLRPGDTGVVAWLGLLSDPIGNIGVRRRDLQATVDDLEARDVTIWELATNRRSSDKAERDAMLADAWAGLAKARFDKATASPGRPQKITSDADKQIVWDEWHDKKHDTNAAAARAASEKLKRKIGAHLMWRIVLEMRKARGDDNSWKGGSGRRAGRREPDLGPEWDKHKPQVYFLRKGDTDHVKIGFSCRLNMRISGLRSSNSDKLHLLATVSGGREAEGRLHKRFARHRIKGEWYRLEGKLAEYVARLPKPKRPM